MSSDEALLSAKAKSPEEQGTKVADHDRLELASLKATGSSSSSSSSSSSANQAALTLANTPDPEAENDGAIHAPEAKYPEAKGDPETKPRLIPESPSLSSRPLIEPPRPANHTLAANIPYPTEPEAKGAGSIHGTPPAQQAPPADTPAAGIPPQVDEKKIFNVTEVKDNKLCNAYVVLVLKSILDLDLARGSFVVDYTFVCHVDVSHLQPVEKNAVKRKLYFRLDEKPESFGEPIMGESMGQAMGDATEGKKPMLKFSARRTSTVTIPVIEQLRAVQAFPFDRFEIRLRFEIPSVWVGPLRRRIRFILHHPEIKADGFHAGIKHREVDKLPEFEIKFSERECWGEKVDKHNSQPFIVYGLNVARISNNIVWTTFFPLGATQALLVMLHTLESISVGDMATIMLALFAFLTSAREKIPVFPLSSMLDKTVLVFVLQLVLVCIDFFVDWVYPEHGPEARRACLILATVVFGLEFLTVLYWFSSSATLLKESDMEWTGQQAERFVKAKSRPDPCYPTRWQIDYWCPWKEPMKEAYRDRKLCHFLTRCGCNCCCCCFLSPEAPPKEGGKKIGVNHPTQK